MKSIDRKEKYIYSISIYIGIYISFFFSIDQIVKKNGNFVRLGQIVQKSFFSFLFPFSPLLFFFYHPSPFAICEFLFKSACHGHGSGSSVIYHLYIPQIQGRRIIIMDLNFLFSLCFTFLLLLKYIQTGPLTKKPKKSYDFFQNTQIRLFRNLFYHIKKRLNDSTYNIIKILGGTFFFPMESYPSGGQA